MFKRVLGLLVVVVVCASCITGVKAGKRCNTSEWGDDGTYALKCENGRWVRKATKAQVAQLLIAIAKAKQAAQEAPRLPSRPDPNDLTVGADGQITRGGGGTAVHVDGANGWYGIVFRVSSSQYEGELVHLGDGPNPAVLSVEPVVRRVQDFRLIPSGDGNHAAVPLSDHSAVGQWARDPAQLLSNWPYPINSVTCITSQHLISMAGTDDQGYIDRQQFSVAGHPETLALYCSPAGRFVSLVETSGGLGYPERAELYDTITGSFATVATGVDLADEVDIFGASNNGSFVGVDTASGSVAGVWSRATGVVTPMAGYQSGDAPVLVNDDGSRVIGVRSSSASDRQLVLYGPRGSALFGASFVTATEFEFNPDLQSGMRLDTDGTLRIIHPDWSGPG